MFANLAKAEDGLNGRAQEALGRMGLGPAAELLGRMAERGDAIKDHSRYVVSAANREEREKGRGKDEEPESLRQGDEGGRGDGEEGSWGDDEGEEGWGGIRNEEYWGEYWGEGYEEEDGEDRLN